MNKKILLLITFLVITANFYGQRRPDREKIKTLKVAFFTERLDLSSKEAEKFWPLYNEYEQQKEALRQKERNEIQSKIRETEALSEKEAESLLKQFLSIQEEEEELRQTFIRQIAKVISPKRTFVLLRAEKDFKRRLIKEYRNRRGNNKR